VKSTNLRLTLKAAPLIYPILHPTKSEVDREGSKKLGRPKASSWVVYLSCVQIFWAFVEVEIMNLLQV